MVNHPLHPLPYPQPTIITSTAYLLKAFANAVPSKHCFTKTVPAESIPNYVPPVRLNHRS